VTGRDGPAERRGRRTLAQQTILNATVAGIATFPAVSTAVTRQLGHSNLGITSIYLQGIDNAEIIETVHARRTPMIQVNTLLRR